MNPPCLSDDQTPLSIEQAFQRLDELLRKLNSGELSLEESLLCYEEAEVIAGFCSRLLGDAERRIEKLVKNRQGVVSDERGEPKTEPLVF